MRKTAKQSPVKAPEQKPKPSTFIKEKTERYLVEARYSPRGDWTIESQDAVLAGAISTAGAKSRKHASGTAEHRVRDTQTGTINWTRGHIDVGIKTPSEDK